jgi:hypothetical protein
VPSAGFATECPLPDRPARVALAHWGEIGELPHAAKAREPVDPILPGQY